MDQPSHAPALRRTRHRGPAWERLGTGVQIAAGLDGRDRVIASLRAWAEVLPASAVFTSLTALELHGIWLPPLPPDLPVFVAVPTSARRIRRPELRVTRRPCAPSAVRVEGVAVEPVADAILAAACDLHLVDLVVMIDAALHLRLCTLADLRSIAARRRRGTPRLRAAIAASDRSESPWESLLRLLHRACDVPVDPQVELRTSDGVFIARADLVIRGTRTLQEYDGGDHLQPGRYARDRRRDRRLAAGGYVRHGYVSSDVVHRAVGVLRAADRALGRPHDPARIRAWHALLRESLFSEAGTAALRRRWGLPDVDAA